VTTGSAGLPPLILRRQRVGHHWHPSSWAQSRMCAERYHRNAERRRARVGRPAFSL